MFVDAFWKAKQGKSAYCQKTWSRVTFNRVCKGFFPVERSLIQSSEKLIDHLARTPSRHQETFDLFIHYKESAL